MKKILLAIFILLISATSYARVPAWLNIESGLKGVAGGDLWVAAENSPSLSNMAFTETTGGWAAGFGAFVELRFIKYIALDTEFLFGWDQVVEKDTVNGLKIEFTAKSFSFKIPILLKGVLPLPGIKLTLGTGPILEIPISGKGTVDQPITMQFDVKTKFSVLWAVDLGLDIKLPKHFRLPINLRAAYNISQPSSYGDRVKLNTAGRTIRSMDMTYQNTWEFCILMGVAYEL